MTSQQSTLRESRVPMNLGWIALIFGVICLIVAELIRWGVLPNADYPFGGLGVALVVGGYIASFMIPPLHRRISTLEQRIDAIEEHPTEPPRK